MFAKPLIETNFGLCPFDIDPIDVLHAEAEKLCVWGVFAIPAPGWNMDGGNIMKHNLRQRGKRQQTRSSRWFVHACSLTTCLEHLGRLCNFVHFHKFDRVWCWVPTYYASVVLPWELLAGLPPHRHRSSKSLQLCKDRPGTEMYRIIQNHRLEASGSPLAKGRETEKYYEIRRYFLIYIYIYISWCYTSLLESYWDSNT